VKSRPSGEKRRKEMQRQERNREKEERRKLRKEEKLHRPADGEEGATDVAPDADSASGVRDSLPSPGAVSGSEVDAISGEPGSRPASLVR